MDAKFSYDEVLFLWHELEDVLFVEDGSYLVLEFDWFIFEAGTEREDIWHWFDKHSKNGVYELMFG